jgi:hypothetical protein
MIAADSVSGGLRLAADGIDCVTSGVPMNEYLARQPTGGPVYNVTNPQGSIIGGEHQTVNQTNTFGFSPGEVPQLDRLRPSGPAPWSRPASLTRPGDCGRSGSGDRGHGDRSAVELHCGILA